MKTAATQLVWRREEVDINVSKQLSVLTRFVSFESGIDKFLNCLCIVVFASIMWLQLQIIGKRNVGYVRTTQLVHS